MNLKLNLKGGTRCENLVSDVQSLHLCGKSSRILLLAYHCKLGKTRKSNPLDRFSNHANEDLREEYEAQKRNLVECWNMEQTLWKMLVGNSRFWNPIENA